MKIVSLWTLQHTLPKAALKSFLLLAFCGAGAFNKRWFNSKHVHHKAQVLWKISIGRMKTILYVELLSIIIHIGEISLRKLTLIDVAAAGETLYSEAHIMHKEFLWDLWICSSSTVDHIIFHH